jgi:hypothetical protein
LNFLFRTLFFLSLFTNCFGQNTTFQIWTETGIRGKLMKRLDWNLSLTNRFQDYQLVTIFPQASLKYKITKWLKSSIDYRWIGDRENNGNFSGSHRLNFNLLSEAEVKRLSINFRLRYQYSFKGITTNYEPEFDNAIRFKTSITYDIKNSFLNPILSTEFFYNPNQGMFGERFTRVRSFMGLDLNLKGPHEVQVGYFFDQKINLPRPDKRNVLNLQYTYNISGKSKKKEKS